MKDPLQALLIEQLKTVSSLQALARVLLTPEQQGQYIEQYAKHMKQNFKTFAQNNSHLFKGPVPDDFLDDIDLQDLDL